MSGPYVILSNRLNAYYNADGTGRGDRKFWVVREADATTYRTRADAAKVIASKFSYLTSGDHEIVQLVGPRIPRARQLGLACCTQLAGSVS